MKVGTILDLNDLEAPWDRLNGWRVGEVILRKASHASIATAGSAVFRTHRRHLSNGESWEALMMSPNNIAYADCVARVTRYAAVLRTEYALAE